jgi:SAM-dependent methyltransferase
LLSGRPEESIEDSELQPSFGGIDIYLFDQLLRGHITPGMRLLDAGCGSGRNLAPLLRLGFDVSATDEDRRAIDAVRRLAANVAPHLPMYDDVGGEKSQMSAQLQGSLMPGFVGVRTGAY